MPSLIARTSARSPSSSSLCPSPSAGWILKALVVVVVSGVATVAQFASAASPEVTAKRLADLYASYDRFLDSIVIDRGGHSVVRYERARHLRADRVSLKASFEGVTEAEYLQLNEAARLAFLINLYNFMTIELIAENYPVRSIKDLGNFLQSPWKKRFFSLFGESQHLDYVEHTVIRQQFAEPRIHFALVCASVGCPKLQKRVFLPETLNSQLEEATRTFLCDSTRNRFDEKTGGLALSKIFSWYGDDFEVGGSSVRKFVSRYMSDDASVQKLIGESNAAVAFLDYDWSLNDAEPSSGEVDAPRGN